MSWGGRSCLKPCRCPETCSMATCEVTCPGYIWDGVVSPDSSIPVMTLSCCFNFNKLHKSGLNRAERRARRKK